MTFGCELTEEEIDILTEWMVYEWLTPYLNNSENLRNKLSNERLFNVLPANLLIQYRMYTRKAESEQNQL